MSVPETVLHVGATGLNKQDSATWAQDPTHDDDAHEFDDRTGGLRETKPYGRMSDKTETPPAIQCTVWADDNEGV